MRYYLSELFKKIALRPLLIPAVVVFIFSMIFCLVSVNKKLDYDSDYISKKVVVTDVTIKLDGKKSYIGISDKNRYSLNTDLDLYPGDSFIATGIITKPDIPTNPGEFDYSKYLRNKGVIGVFNVQSIESYNESEMGRELTKIRYLIRNWICDLLDSRMNAEDSGILSALCLGDSSLVDKGIIRNFRVSNCSHILAVSGSHFSSFIIILPFLFGIFRIDGKKSTVITVIFILLIGFMTGWSESVTRAALMSICSIFMRDTLSGMCFAAIVMLLANPFSALSSGFQMSFCACISIICLNKYVSKFAKKYIKSKRISEGVAVGICSQFGLLIFSISNSSRLGIITFLTQLLGGFLIEVICVFFVIGIFLSLISFSFEPASLMARILVELMETSSMFFDFSLSLKDFGFIPICLFCLIIILCFKNSFFFKRWYKFLSLILVMIITLNTISLVINTPKTRVIFIDVGQGDSCLIITSKFNCLIDSGIGENGLSTIPDVLDYYSISKLDFAIMTHWDEDHGGGMIELLKSGRLDYIYTSFVGMNDNVGQMLEAYFDSDDIENVLINCFRELHAGQCIQLSDNDILDVIWPYSGVTEGDNADSVVMNLNSYGTNILFTGDIDFGCEDEIMNLNLIHKTDVLKIAHHGSKYSSSSEFLKVVSPENAVISVAEHNFYGHPAPETVERLKKVKANVFQTSKNGAIIVNIFTTNYEISTFKENKNAF